MHQSYRDALDSLREPLFIVDARRKLRFANKALIRFLKEDEGVELRLADFWADAERSDFKHEEFAAEFVNSRQEVFAVRLLSSPIDGDLHVVRVIAGGAKTGSIVDFHNQRIETLGMLAGGVAHDFNNILAGILGHVTYLKTILPGQGPHIESLTAIEEGGKKASLVTQQILNFSRLDPEQKPTRVDLCEAVRKTCLLLRGAISPLYPLEQEYISEPALVLATEGSIAQIVVNLAMNARDAYSSPAPVKIRVRGDVPQEEVDSAFGEEEAPPGRFYALEVIDTGHGMSSDVLERIFEPYFTTKRNKGTGLGLSTVRALVRLYGGAITVDSVVGEGTKVAVLLPRFTAPGAESKGDGSGARSLPGGRESVLVVDDEHPVRNVLCVSLRHLGYNVEVASSGAEALDKFAAKEQLGTPYDLVLLDMLMPQIPGEKVFSKMRSISPQCRVLIISGYSSEEAIRRMLSQGKVDFLQKPFTIEQLALKVRSCLETE